MLISHDEARDVARGDSLLRGSLPPSARLPLRTYKQGQQLIANGLEERTRCCRHRTKHKQFLAGDGITLEHLQLNDELRQAENEEIKTRREAQAATQAQERQQAEELRATQRREAQQRLQEEAESEANSNAYDAIVSRRQEANSNQDDYQSWCTAACRQKQDAGTPHWGIGRVPDIFQCGEIVCVR